MPSEYSLSNSERKILVNKVLPVLFVGSLIWLASELLFGTIFTHIAFPPDTVLIIYILMSILNGILLLLFFFISQKGNTILGIILYFTFAFTAGIIAVPISMSTVWDIHLRIYVHAFVSLVFAGTVIVLIMGLVFKKNFFKKGYFWYHVLIFGIATLIVMIIFILIYSVQNIILITIALAFLILTIVLITLYGIKLTKKIKEDYWIYIVFRVIGSLLFFSFLVIIILIVFAISVVLAEGDIYIGDISGGGAPSGKRKGKKKIPMK